ncbi:MAG: phosphatase PAP2 family protein [Gemmatimonadetes bacterium]|nr:phosphatase PAP2 family protein [Gemmatimonadota bacterium]
MRAILLAVAIQATAVPSLWAQHDRLGLSPPPDSARARSEAVSVYRIGRTDVAITGIGTAAVVLPYAFASRLITPHCPCDASEVNRLDRVAIGKSSRWAGIASNVSVALAVIAPLALDYLDVGVSPALLEDAGVFAQTLAIDGALVTLTKYLVQRPFPGTYAGDADLLASPRGYRAFYSGHTSLAFAALSAAAMTARRRHGEKGWPWVLTMLVGGSVAAELVVSGKHFPTDVAAGALAGTAVGIVVPLLHLRAPRPRTDLP